MMSKPNLLIIGMGNMGSLHAKYADLLEVDWHWHDPSPLVGADPDRCVISPHLYQPHLPYSHIIVATPASTHADHLRDLKDFEGRILVEKPGVMEVDDLPLLDNPLVSVGLVERFNPAFEALAAKVDPSLVLNIDFIRCSARPVSRIKENSFFDVGIHDIDLFLQLFRGSSIDHIAVYSTSNTFCLMAKLDTKQVARFIWSNETFYKERMIKVRESYCNYECNLIDQTVKRHSLSTDNKNTVEDVYVEKASPLRRELEYFLGAPEMFSRIPTRVDSRESHRVFLDVLGRINEMEKNDR